MENPAILLRRLNPYCALSQQLLTHMAAKQKPASLTLGWSEEEGVELAFSPDRGETP